MEIMRNTHISCLFWLVYLLSCRQDPPHAAGRVCPIDAAVEKEMTHV